MKKNAILLFLIFLGSNVFAQEITKNHFELSLKYAIQKPFYSVTSPIDIIAVSHDNRYRSRLSLGCRFYVFNKWFAEYNLAYSQEGGGYNAQYTNTNYLKNGINIGFSSNHNRRLIFELYTGVDLNLLLNSKFVNKETDFSENVTNFNNRFVVSFPFLGTGFKTKIYEQTFVSVHTFLSMSKYNVSSEENTMVSQVIIPAFQIGISKFLK